MNAVRVDLDLVLGNTRPLWDAWLEDLRRRARVKVDLPRDRHAAVLLLDGAVGNWRALLERFAEEHAPLHLRPDPDVNAALRRLDAAGIGVEAVTDAPAELVRVALSQLGASRYVSIASSAAEATIRTREEFLASARAGQL